MATRDKNLSDVRPMPGKGSNKDLSFGVVSSLWNEEITDALLKGCLTYLTENGVLPENIHSIQVPGSYELPSGAKLLISNKKLDAVICLGCIIKGETKHDEFIATAIAGGLINLGIHSNIPCIFGVLTTNDLSQAKERAGGKHGNKGIEAASSALHMAILKRSFSDSTSKIGFGQ